MKRKNVLTIFAVVGLAAVVTYFLVSQQLQQPHIAKEEFKVKVDHASATNYETGWRCYLNVSFNNTSSVNVTIPWFLFTPINVTSIDDSSQFFFPDTIQNRTLGPHIVFPRYTTLIIQLWINVPKQPKELWFGLEFKPNQADEKITTLLRAIIEY